MKKWLVIMLFELLCVLSACSGTGPVSYKWQPCFQDHTIWISDDATVEIRISFADSPIETWNVYPKDENVSAIVTPSSGYSGEFGIEFECNSIVTGEFRDCSYISEREFIASARDRDISDQLDDELHIFRVDQTVSTERTAPKTKPLSTSVKAGKYVSFGSYEQDNDTANGSEEIIWRVLEVQDGRALLLSEYVLDALPYCDAAEVPSWETSTVRSWLNSDFCSEAFDDTERAMICPTELVTEDNPISVNSTEITTTDSVFLLSTKEERQYFSKQKQLIAEPTAYAAAQGVYVCSITRLLKHIDRCGWWLRDSCSDDNRAAFISFDGDDELGGARAAFEHYGVRPAIWVELPEA